MTKIQIPNEIMENEWIKRVYANELTNINLPKIDNNLQYKSKSLTEIVKEMCSNLDLIAGLSIFYKTECKELRNEISSDGKYKDVWGTGVDTKIYKGSFIINASRKGYNSNLKAFMMLENTYFLNYDFVKYFQGNKLTHSLYSQPESEPTLKIKKQLKISFEKDKIGIIGRVVNKINFMRNVIRENYFMPNYFEITNTEYPKIPKREKQDNFSNKKFQDVRDLCADIEQKIKDYQD